MGGGCLSPKPREGDIYIETINRIFQEVRNSEYSSYHDLYEAIKQKISKKGFLRKLMDYLSCHRDKINEAAAYSMRITAQSKQNSLQITGLIILDHVIKSISNDIGLSSAYRSSKLSEESMLKSIHINLSEYQESQRKKEGYIKSHTHTRIDKENISSSPDFQMSQSLVLAEINSQKFQTTYLSLIYLLIQESTIYEKALQSIIFFCSLNNNKFCHEEKLSEIQDILVQHIKTNDEVELSLECYSILLMKTKDSIKLKKINTLKYFILVWSQAEKRSKSSKAIHFQEDRLKIQHYCEIIISRYMQCAVTGSDFSSIYQIVLEFYDKKSFSGIEPMEDMVISITKNHDLKQQFFRGFFTSLLTYFGFTCQQKSTQRWNKLSFFQNSDSFKKKYSEANSQQTKQNIMQLIKKWITKDKLIELKQIIQYNCTLFVEAYLLNISSTKSKEFRQRVKVQFILLCNLVPMNQNIIVVNLLFEEFFNCQTHVNNSIHHRRHQHHTNHNSSKSDYQRQLIQIIGSIVKKIEICNQGENFKFNHPLVELQIQSRVMYLQCIINISSHIVNISYEQNQQYCRLLAMTFQLLAIEMVEIQQLYVLAIHLIKLCQIMSEKHSKQLIAAFIERVCCSLREIKIKQNLIICEFMLMEISQVAIPSALKKIIVSIEQKSYMPFMLQKYQQNRHIEQLQQVMKGIVNEVKDQKVYVISRSTMKDMFKTGVSYAHSPELEGTEIAFIKSNSIIIDHIQENSEISFHQIVNIIQA